MLTRFSIRSKLLLVALLLLLIPWMSYIYVRDMKAFLLSGQEDVLNVLARAVATVLHDRPELFDPEEEEIAVSSEENEIYAFPLPNYINLNGEFSDWGEQANQAVIYRPPSSNDPIPTVDGEESDDEFTNQAISVLEMQQEQTEGSNTLISPTEEDISVRHVLGYRGNFIYALFDVSDNNVVFRKKEILRVDAADHLRLTLQDTAGREQRFTLIAGEPGRMSIYAMDEEWQYPITGEPIYDLAAEMALSDSGYRIEIRIPRFLLPSSTRIRLAVVDVDDTQTLDISAIVPTTPQSENDDLSRLTVQSPELAKILRALNRTDTRIWVIDEGKRVRTVVGNVILEDDENQVTKPTSGQPMVDRLLGYINYYYNYGLQSVFSYIVEGGNENDLEDDDARNDEIIDKALAGKISSDRRPGVDGQGMIIMSAHPIYLGESIPGAVVVEQSTNQVLRRQQETLENVISVTLLVLVTVATALLLFASRLTLRIRRLRDAADSAIDREGRILNQRLPKEEKSGDEIGDLSRSVSNMLGRLSQYTTYLKGLPDTLAHEVSNPLNVVNSSLHNLSRENSDAAKSKYMERAKNGLNRIGAILQNLTEAANLEQALQDEERETIDLIELLESYVDGYAFSNPSQKFRLITDHKPIMVDVAPDYIAQALDKLVDNALDFAAPKTPIVIHALRSNNVALIEVSNEGSSLPDGMAERIFEPLVSLGRKDAQKTRLGMGLYVVKLITSFHGGDVLAHNMLNKQGVTFTIKLPIHDLFSSTLA